MYLNLLNLGDKVGRRGRDVMKEKKGINGSGIRRKKKEQTQDIERGRRGLMVISNIQIQIFEITSF